MTEFSAPSTDVVSPRQLFRTKTDKGGVRFVITVALRPSHLMIFVFALCCMPWFFMSKSVLNLMNVPTDNGALLALPAPHEKRSALLNTKKSRSTSQDRLDLLIAVICDASSIWTLGPTVLDTWVKDIPFDVRFFVGSETGDVPEAIEPYTVRLNATDQYPPRQKVFELWREIHDNFGDYSWYLKMDIDSYINGPALQRVVRNLLKSHNTFGYRGNAGDGRDFEAKKLGLKAKYCLGMGYFIGKSTLRSMRKEIDWCYANPKSNHSDTEIGNCVYRASKYSCEEIGAFSNLYYSYEPDGRVTNAKVKASKSEQFMNVSQAHFFGKILGAALVHPLKNPSDMWTLHNQVKRQLHPVLPEPWMDDGTAGKVLLHKIPEENRSEAATQAIMYYEKACVNNPLVQEYLTGVRLPECTPEVPRIASPSISNITTYVLNLKGHEERYEAIVRRFSNTSLTLQRFEGLHGNKLYSEDDLPFVAPRELPPGEEDYMESRRLKPGEKGYLITMRAVFEKALQDGVEVLLVLDDDAIPRRDFDTQLLTLLRAYRCGGHLFTDHGGILQLGASVWNPQMWKYLEEDRRHTRLKYMRKDGRKCFNAHQQVLGSFATLYHRNVYEEIIDWIDNGPPQPFDWVYGWLAKKGYITRVAGPYLAIMDVEKDSVIDNNRGSEKLTMFQRATIHRWRLSDFITEE